MYKFLLFLFFAIFSFSANALAELYHGIDIDTIYERGEWSSKNFIKQVIDDNTLLIQYQDELDNCPDFLPEILDCYDKLAVKIVTTLYEYPEINLEKYKKFKKALSEAYGLKNCRNKYAWPAGNMCKIDIMDDMSNILKIYIQDLINFTKENMSYYSPILKDYK